MSHAAGMLRSDPLVGQAMAALPPINPPPRGRSADSRPFDLLRHAAAEIAAHAGRGLAWPGSPLVLVAGNPPPGGLLDDLRRSCAPLPGSGAWDGRELGREMARAGGGEDFHRLRDRLLAGPLLVVADLDGLDSWGAQRRFAGILDAATAAGTSVCVTMTSHPAAGAFVPRLASRLCAGLIVPLPTAAGHPAAHTTGVESATQPSLASVIRTTARQLGLAPEHLVGPGRQRSIVQARSLAMYLSRQLTGRSLGDIGRALGGRDHSTVIHGIRNATGRLRRDPGFAADATKIAAELLRRPRSGSARRRRRSG